MQPTIGAPQSLTAAASGNGEVTLTWTAPADDGGLGIDGYHYRYGETGNLGDDWKDAGDVLTVTISNLTNGTAYDFEVRAFNSGGNGPAAMVSAMPVGGSGALQSLAAVATSHNMVTLTWTAPSDTGGLAITGYDYRSYETGGTPPDAWEDAGDVLTVDVTGLTKNTDYTFEVRAMNSAGSGPAATATATTLREPDAPGALTAASGDGEVKLTWAAPANDGGLAITGYEYRSYETGGTPPDAWEDAGDVLTVDVTGLTNRTEYTFEVRAVNLAGPGAEESATQTPSSKPGSVRNLTATGGAGSVTLDWDEPSDNGGSAIVRYEVQKYNATSTNWDAAYSGADTSYTDGSATIGATTEYRVRAYNANANDPSDWTTVSGIAQARGVPLAPTKLTAIRGDGSITFTWEAPASNGGANITSYEYKRPWITANAGDEPTDWTTASGTGASFPNLDNESTYSFRVRAVNIVGGGEAASLTGIAAATKPSLPRRFTARAHPTDPSIDLDWDDPLEDGGADETTFHLQVRVGADGTWADVTNFEATATNLAESLDITGLTHGATYYYRIRAINAHSPFVTTAPTEDQEDTREWAETNATVAASWPARVGGATTGEVNGDDVTATFANGRVKVSWMAPNNHGRPITSYRLRWRSARDDDDGTEFPAANVVSVQASATEYIMVGPAPATGYVFQVLAVNSLTDEDEIDVAPAGDTTADPIKWSLSSTPELTVPNVTEQGAVSPDGLAVSTPTADGRVTITWRMRAQQDNMTPPVTQYTAASYDLEYVVVDADTTLDADADEWDDATKENIAAQALMQRIIGPLAGNMNLFTRIRVVSSVGVKSTDRATDPEDGWTQVGPTSIPARAPEHPELTATIIGQNVILTWDKPESNGSQIERYEIQFKKDDGDFGDGNDGVLPDGTGDADEDDVITLPRRDDPAEDGDDTLLDPVTTYSHEGLDGGATYTYRIRTVTECNDDNAGGCSGAAAVDSSARKWSAEVVATSDAGPPADPVVPGIPTLTATARDADGHVELSWTKPSPGTSPITGYQIQRWDGSAWEMLPTSLGAEDTKYEDATAELGTMYYYAIRAVSGAGEGEYTQRSFPSAMLVAKAPDTPTITPTVDGQTIVLSWTAPAANGADITAYQIQVTATGPVTDDGVARADADREWGNDIPSSVGDETLSPTPALATMYRHSSLTPGRTLYYRMRAINSVNENVAVDAANAEWSGEVSATVAAMAPNAPALADAPDDGDTVVVLRWTLTGPDNDPNGDNDVQETGGSPITSVEIQRWNSSTAQWDDIRTHPVSLTDADPPDYTPASETYTDTGREDGTMYTYRIRTVNAAGESPWSNMDSSTTADAAPDFPTLKATADGQDVVLSWNTPDDNGAEITAYHIQRFPSVANDETVNNDWGDDVGEDGRDGTGGNADDDPAAESDVIIPMPAGVTTYTDRALLPGTTYYYRIRAVNSVNTGRTGTARTWSTEAQVTTAPKAPDKMTLELEEGDKKITLTWTVPLNNGSPISQYQIQRWDSVDRMWKTIKDQLPASVTTFVDDDDGNGLVAGERYFYRIRAVNAGGEGAWSTLTSETTEEPADE